MLLIVAMITIALSGCASINEALDWQHEGFARAMTERTGWKGINGEETLFLVYLKNGETPEHWSEEIAVEELPISIITYRSDLRWSPESFMNNLKAKIQKDQCLADKWTVLQKNETSILFELQNINCPRRIDQQQITRIVLGQWHVWILTYGIKDKVLSADEKTAIINKLLTAKIIHD